jgi:5S rRNA maturation endonuclease (ribonuclease M5)
VCAAHLPPTEGGCDGEDVPHEELLEPAFAEFLELWPKLVADGERPGTVVVVEGERDRRSIRGLGWAGPIVIFHRGRSLAATAQALVAGSRRVIVLTDWDVEGGHLAHRLKEFLAAEHLELDLESRRRLARALRGEVVHVEGLHRWARRNADRRGVALESMLAIGPADDPTG